MKLITGIINLITSLIYFVTFLSSPDLIYVFLSLIFLISACLFLYIYFDESNRNKI